LRVVPTQQKAASAAGKAAAVAAVDAAADTAGTAAGALPAAAGVSIDTGAVVSLGDGGTPTSGRRVNATTDAQRGAASSCRTTQEPTAPVAPMTTAR